MVCTSWGTLSNTTGNPLLWLLLQVIRIPFTAAGHSWDMSKRRRLYDRPAVWMFGDIKVTAIVDDDDADDVIQKTLPGASAAKVVATPGMIPGHAHTDGRLKGVVQAYIIDIPARAGQRARRIMIDTCVGEHKDLEGSEFTQWHMRKQSRFLKRLRTAGYSASSITDVFCTHLHQDHIGWNTRWVRGAWQATFKKAAYWFVQEEFDFWRTLPDVRPAVDERLPFIRKSFAESIAAIPESSRRFINAATVNGFEMAPGVTLSLTPGHTPYHSVAILQAGGAAAVFVGDLMHSALQAIHTDITAAADTNPADGTRSRRTLVRNIKRGAVLGAAKTAALGGKQSVTLFLAHAPQAFRLRPDKAAPTGWRISQHRPDHRCG